MIFTYVGDMPPADPSKWNLYGSTTRPQLDITFGGDIVPGSQVWVTAQWFNPRAQTGPLCEPKSTRVQCPTMWFEQPEMRQAA